MADFKKAYDLTSVYEGGYANDRADRGGETWKGIARNMHPSWEGWSVIDELKKDSRFPAILRSNESLEAMVQAFYKKIFWDAIRGDEIIFQEIANTIYDDAVNTGIASAIKKAQNVVFGLVNDDKEKMYMIKNLGIQYGTMDSITLKKLNLV
jgi:lysozyme family protein